MTLYRPFGYPDDNVLCFRCLDKHGKRRRGNFAFCDAFQCCMSFALLVIIFHVIQARETGLSADRIALVSGVLQGSASYTTNNVWFAILMKPLEWFWDRDICREISYKAERRSETRRLPGIRELPQGVAYLLCFLLQLCILIQDWLNVGRFRDFEHCHAVNCSGSHCRV